MYREKDLCSSVTFSQGRRQNVNKRVRQATRRESGFGAAVNGPAIKHFAVPETTARGLKSEYLQKLKAMQHAENTTVVVKLLPTRPQEGLFSLAVDSHSATSLVWGSKPSKFKNCQLPFRANLPNFMPANISCYMVYNYNLHW